MSQRHRHHSHHSHKHFSWRGIVFVVLCLLVGFMIVSLINHFQGNSLEKKNFDPQKLNPEKIEQLKKDFEKNYKIAPAE